MLRMQLALNAGIQLYINQPKIFQFKNGLIYCYYYLFKGARILVHNRTTYPQFFNGIMIPSGSQAYVQVDRVFSSHMEQPYSDCVRNIDENYPSKFVKILLKTGYAYTQQLCFMACYQNVVIKQCGCYELYSQTVTSYPYINETDVQSCRNSSQIRCHELV